MNPEMSVVIPTLGRPTLMATLRSLSTSQGAERLQVLVVGRVDDPTMARQMAEVAPAFGGFEHLPLAFADGDSSRKKNAGTAQSRAPIVAFLDDDVRVAPDWPLRIMEPFARPEVGMVSGPSLVPEDVPFFTRLAGTVLASGATGYVAYRYLKRPGGAREVKWSHIIGCNMAFRRETLTSLGGFDPRFWPGEEMVASHGVDRLGRTIVFHSHAYLYHYPRASLAGFLRQVYGYGATRIRLMRAGLPVEPTTLLPAMWVASLIALSVAAPFWAIGGKLLALNLLLYLAADLYITLAKCAETRRPADACIFFLVPLMHLAYGIGQWIEIVSRNRDLSEAKGPGR